MSDNELLNRAKLMGEVEESLMKVLDLREQANALEQEAMSLCLDEFGNGVGQEFYDLAKKKIDLLQSVATGVLREESKETSTVQRRPRRKKSEMTEAEPVVATTATTATTAASVTAPVVVEAVVNTEVTEISGQDFERFEAAVSREGTSNEVLASTLAKSAVFDAETEIVSPVEASVEPEVASVVEEVKPVEKVKDDFMNPFDTFDSNGVPDFLS